MIRQSPGSHLEEPAATASVEPDG